MSGVMTIIAAIVAGRPMLSLLLLATGRVCLGVGESFSSTGATLWGMNLVGPVHTARVISWNGVATYLAMAIGAPLGVLLDQGMGISGFAGLVAFMGGLGFVLASKKPAIIVTVAKRVPFSQVFRRVWIFGLGLSAGTIGFGVIATFITLYFSSRGWGGAAVTLTLYSLGFTVIRLVSGNAINRFGAEGFPDLLSGGRDRTVSALACGFGAERRYRCFSYRLWFLADLSCAGCGGGETG